MKKIKKAIKKIPKTLIAITLVIAILLNYITPLTKVFADDTYTYVLTFTINSNAKDEHTMENDGGHLKIDNQYVELRDGDTSVGTTNCNNDNTECTITVTDGPEAKLNYNGAQRFLLYMQGHNLDINFVFTNNENISIEDYVEAGPEQGESRFDGRAVVLWSCGEGVCYHEFGIDDTTGEPEIGDFNDGNSTFFKDTEIEADNKPGTTFNVNAEYKEWYLTDEFNTWQELYKIANGIASNAEINWNTMDPKLILGSPKDGNEFGPLEEAVNETNYCETNESLEHCINRYAAEENHEIWTHELQPVGEPTENNAYVSYGDRNFKVVIYNEDYKGVTTTADFSGLNYYPASWADPFLRTDQYDISDTTENHPTYLESILLEDTVNLDILPYNNYQVDTIEALDVPSDAVTITKLNSRKYKIVFSSNFYDHVIFKLTDNNGEVSYVQIKRYTIDGYIRNDNERQISILAADFYFDRKSSYQDYIITAKIVYKDGSIENVNLDPIQNFTDGLGNPVENWEFDQENPNFEFSGKGLKMSRFEYDLEKDADRNIQDVYLNAEYKGSDAHTYAGAYSGSGEGTPANLYHPEGGE